MRAFILISMILAFMTFANGQIVDTIYVQAGDIKIHTVLTKPENKKKHPLAIIIAGSGPTDLNGNQLAMSNNSLKYLSDALVKNQITTLRFDKRGIAGSKIKGLNEADLKIDNYANDVALLIKYFRHKGYQDVYVIGHSEGSLIGLIALQDIKAKGFVSVAGVGNSADILLKNQLKPKLPAEYYSKVEILIDSIKNGHNVKNVPPQLYSLFRPSVQPYLISWFGYDPARLIKNINCPVMIIQGDKDIQVDVEEAKILKSNSPDAELIIIKNMNHIFKTIEGDVQENVASYTNPDLPVNEDLVSSIVKFINGK